jgi:hypothetical protein
VSITGLTEFAADRIFQRAGAARAIAFTGTFGAAPTFLDIRLLAEDGTTVLQDWNAATLDSAAGGSWTATLGVPQGGWYRWQARDQGGASAVSARKFGVGALILCFGQSNMRWMWRTRSSPPAADALTRRWAGFGWFANDLVAQGGEATALHGSSFGGNGGVRLGNALRAGLGVPVGLLQLAVSATEIARWQAEGDCWLNLVAMLNDDCGTAFEAALWHQGERDASLGTTGEAYMAGLLEVIAQARSLSGRPALPFGIAILGRATDGSDAGHDRIRLAQRDVIAATPGAFLAGSSLDLTLSDGVHWDAASYERMGRRYAQSVLAALGAAAFGAAGPRIAGATRQRGTAVVVLPVEQAGGSALRGADNGADGAGLTGFAVRRDGAPLAIASTAFAGNAVLLTLSAVPNGGALTVTYQAGADPDVAAPAYDDAPPQGDARGVPLQPSFAPLPVAAIGESIMSASGATFFASFVLPSASLGADRWLLRLDDGTDSNAIGVVVPAGSASIVPRVVKAGVVTSGIAAGAVTPNAPQRVSLVVVADALRVSVDGAEAVVQAHDVSGLTQLRLGANAAGGAALGGPCGGLRVVPFAVSDAGQATMTAILP